MCIRIFILFTERDRKTILSRSVPKKLRQIDEIFTERERMVFLSRSASGKEWFFCPAPLKFREIGRFSEFFRQFEVDLDQFHIKII